MTLAAIGPREATALVQALTRLLEQGEVPSRELATLPGAAAQGVWWCDAATGVAVASPRLVALRRELPRAEETLAALLACDPALRAAWQRAVLARLLEIGARRELDRLCEAIAALGGLAAELLAEPRPSLEPTPYGELERRVLPGLATEPAALPVLLRALPGLAGLLAGPGAVAPRELGAVTAADPSLGWVAGRLLQLPAVEGEPVAARFVLPGTLADLPGETSGAMPWALARPWAFLLAQLVFTQEAWAAEQIAGGIALELEPGQAGQYLAPPRVQVVVSLPTGQEVPCGSLGALVLRLLADLGVGLLGPPQGPEALDDRLAAVVTRLLQRNVWRFSPGGPGQPPRYAIHPTFSDDCYRALGSRSFYRLGTPVTGAIRRTAEGWVRERLARAAASAPAVAPT